MNFANRESLVKSVQKALGLADDGIDGKQTWQAIADKVGVVAPTIPTVVTPSASSSQTSLSANALKLILDYEVGGGKSYYDRALKHPSYPGGASGVTIGIGYDLGYNTIAQFTLDWKDQLSSADFARLQPCLGAAARRAKDLIGGVKDISIPWDSAFTVFQSNTLPRFIKETIKAFPGSDKLHPDAFGALVSLVFNRGGSVSGISRVEMLNIKNAIINNREDIYDYIAKQIIAMKHLWVNKGLDGLLTRRDDEAKLVKSCA